MKILWKEWQQQKWLIFIGCLAGISVPVLECLLNWSRHEKFQTNMGTAVLLCVGAFFGIILAIAATHHDTKKGTDDFWLSKPLKPWKLFSAKILLAAVMLAICFLLTISLDFITHFSRGYVTFSNYMFFTWESFCYTYPIALLLFALTMFLVVLVRDTAKAALIAIWAGLLVYFLPLLSGVMSWMNVFEQVNTSQHSSVLQFVLWYLTPPYKTVHGTPMRIVGTHSVDVTYMTFSGKLWETVTSPDYLQFLLFLAVMMIGAIAFTVLATISFKRKWLWMPGQKSIVWTMGISAAFIFGVAMVQVGRNLEPVTKFNGKEIIKNAPLDADFMSADFYKKLPGTDPNALYKMLFNDPIGEACIKGDLMFRIRCGYLWQKGKQIPRYWDEYTAKYFILQVYHFPYVQPIMTDKSYEFGIGAEDLFSTEPTKDTSQNIFSCFIKGNYLYAAFRPQMRNEKDNWVNAKNMPIIFSTVDISNPVEPKLVGKMQIESTRSFLKAFANCGNYCFLSDGGQMIIISVEEPTKPKIVKQIPYETGGQSELNAGFPSYGFSVIGDKLLCRGYNRIAILDLNDPARPKIIYDETFEQEQYFQSGEIMAAAYRDGYLYIATNNGLTVRRLVKQPDGTFSSELIGKRSATPIEKLAGRRPMELLFYKGWLVENSGGFGMIVYDVSNPERPKRAYHTETGSWMFDLGIWNGLLYIHTSGFQIYFFDIPEQAATK